MSKQFVDVDPSNVLPKKIKAKNSNVHDSFKVMGSNPDYLLESSLLYTH